MAKLKSNPPSLALLRFEKPRHQVIPRWRFFVRMLLAIALWIAITLVGLAIGMAGYAYFEGMSVADAYVNAAMILSGMGPVVELKTTAGKNLRRQLRDFFRTCDRDRHRLRAGADLPSRAASLPCRAEAR